MFGVDGCSKECQFDIQQPDSSFRLAVIVLLEPTALQQCGVSIAICDVQENTQRPHLVGVQLAEVDDLHGGARVARGMCCIKGCVKTNLTLLDDIVPGR